MSRFDITICFFIFRMFFHHKFQCAINAPFLHLFCYKISHDSKILLAVPKKLLFWCIFCTEKVTIWDIGFKLRSAYQNCAFFVTILVHLLYFYYGYIFEWWAFRVHHFLYVFSNLIQTTQFIQLINARRFVFYVFINIIWK